VKKNKYRKDKRPPGTFVPLPHSVLHSPALTALSPFAAKLLLDLLAQYNGNNNGDLTTAWRVMRARGWASNDSLYKARRELESRGWIQRTRQGGRHVATLWALTIYARRRQSDRQGEARHTAQRLRSRLLGASSAYHVRRTS
jgi:hypothetical protein